MTYLANICQNQINEHRKLLDWLSGIAPIDTEDPENSRIRDKLAEILKTEAVRDRAVPRRPDRIRFTLFITGINSRIFPAQLSDYILRKVCFLYWRQTVLFPRKPVEGIFTYFSLSK